MICEAARLIMVSLMHVCNLFLEQLVVVFSWHLSCSSCVSRFLLFLFLCAADMESMHQLADLTESAEFEGFKRFPADPAPSAKMPSDPPVEPSKPVEPWLRNRLRDKLPFWQTFCTSLFVLSIFTSGYQLPWADGPPLGPKSFSNHPSAFEHPGFVSEAVATLVATGAAMKVASRPFIMSPLGVVPKGLDKLRLILDLRYANSFLRIDSFRYESLKEVSSLCKLKDYICTVDLKFGYHHVDIHSEFWQYLGFEGGDSTTYFANYLLAWLMLASSLLRSSSS
jgi:hypothetical protein